MTRLSHLKLKIHRQRTGSNKWVCLFPPKEKRVQEKHYHWNATIGCAFVHLYKWFVLSNKAVILTDLQECFLALMNSANEVFLLWCCTVEQMLAVASFVPDAFRELQKWSETQVWQTHSCASTSAAAGWTQRARGCTAEQTPTNMLLWCHLAQGRKQCSLSPLIDLLYLKPQLQRTLVSKANHVWTRMLSRSDTFSSERWRMCVEFDTGRLLSDSFQKKIVLLQVCDAWIQTWLGIQMNYMCKSLKPQCSCIRNGNHH